MLADNLVLNLGAENKLTRVKSALEEPLDLSGVGGVFCALLDLDGRLLEAVNAVKAALALYDSKSLDLRGTKQGFSSSKPALGALQAGAQGLLTMCCR